MSKHERIDIEKAVLLNRNAGYDAARCPHCWTSGPLYLFKPHLLDRAGLKILLCSCSQCAGKWRRIEV